MNLLTKIRLSIQFIGLKAVLRTLFYSIHRLWEDIRSQKPRKAAGRLTFPEKRMVFNEIPGGFRAEFNHDIGLEILFPSPTSVCLTWTPGKLPYSSFPEKNKSGSSKTQSKVLTTRINVITEELAGQIRLTSEGVGLVLHLDGAIDFLDAQGGLLNHVHPPALSGSSWHYTARLAPGEKVYGLGQRSVHGQLNGGKYQLWNTDPSGSYGTGRDPLYMNIPIYIGFLDSGSYLVFFENTHKGDVDLRNSDRLEVSFWGGALRAHYFAGSPDELLEAYTDLTGRPELPPRWSLGFHQCRWGYASESDLRHVLEGFKSHALPLQALHQDIDYMRGYRVFTVDPQRYPDLEGLISEMAMRNIALVTIIDPGVKIDPEYAVYQSGKEQDVFVKTGDGNRDQKALVWPGWCVFPDFTTQKARTWWSEQYKTLLSLGVAGIWHDMNEPAAFAAWGDMTLPPDSTHGFDGIEGSHLEAHNIYGTLMNQSGHEALRKHQPDKRPWLLSRSGWAGSQQYAWHWTADVENTWDALRMSISMMIHLGLSGFAYTGTDIGGFSGNPDAELFTRWFQAAAFHPFFRNHAARGTQPREPWVYGEPYTSVIRDFIHLRLKFLPYWYTLAEETARTGCPLIRPLFWLSPQEETLHRQHDAFLVGSDVLVAPITTPGAKNRPITLPPGEWLSFWSGDLHQGGQRITTPAQLETIPIFIRAGAVIPLEVAPNTLELIFYPDEHSAAVGRIYYDAGDGYSDSGLAEISLDDTGLIVKTKGAFPFPWEKVSARNISDNTVFPVTFTA